MYEEHCAGGHAGSLQVYLTQPFKPGVEGLAGQGQDVW